MWDWVAAPHRIAGGAGCWLAPEAAELGWALLEE